MKDFMKGLVGTAVLTFLMIFGWSNSNRIYALDEETSQEIQENETETSKWFDKEVISEVIHYTITVVGVVSGICVFIRKIKNIKSAFENKADASAKEITTMKEENEKLLNKNVETLEEIKFIKNEIIASNENTIKMIQELVALTNGRLDKVIEVDKLVYTNNTGLVRTGVATKIAEVLEHETSDQA